MQSAIVFCISPTACQVRQIGFYVIDTIVGNKMTAGQRWSGVK